MSVTVRVVKIPPVTTFSPVVPLTNNVPPVAVVLKSSVYASALSNPSYSVIVLTAWVVSFITVPFVAVSTLVVTILVASARFLLSYLENITSETEVTSPPVASSITSSVYFVTLPRVSKFKFSRRVSLCLCHEASPEASIIQFEFSFTCFFAFPYASKYCPAFVCSVLSEVTLPLLISSLSGGVDVYGAFSGETAANVTVSLSIINPCASYT